MNQQDKQSIEELIALTNIEIPVLAFIVNLILAGILSYLLSIIYVRYGHTLSNRKSFSRNFLIIAMTTMVIITIVKSSLALSLGLVGALSIVRFRSAIKEPEELSYLFLSIAIGLGMGANQGLITILGFAIILSIIIFRRVFSKKSGDSMNMFITVTSPDPDNTDIDGIISILESKSQALDLKRLDTKSDIIEAFFLIELETKDQLSSITKSFKDYDSKISLSYIDNQGLY